MNGPGDTTTPQGAETLEQRQINEDIPIIAVDIPILFEDEGQEEMGESLPHTRTEGILHYGIKAHLASRPELQALANMNLYYHPIRRWAYISPDVMVVRPKQQLSRDLASYRIGEEGPAPIFTAEVLSRRTFQQQDLTNKPIICSRIGIREYLLLDVTGVFLPQKLLIQTLQSDGTWIETQDADGGITSELGFRVVIEGDGNIRVIDAATGKRYALPGEAESEAEARRRTEEALREEEEARQEAEKGASGSRGRPAKG